MTFKPSAGDASCLAWFKSSYSTADGPSCVEVAATPRTVHVRDSKDVRLPSLGFAAAAWADFVPYATDVPEKKR
ncbi:DUF397 domain-containing protein [Streptomyces sp. JV176]|uniref:DUF397 domain-containing protein n=1 Tax=Streptomyces sp. JV176 TaxID=858630 RepID=UPI002E77873D|nr:DUF397 domain-containing protein [Streptomyces sp. JV176]MEE1803858.1 DUF397 domain-containing protein [Streptomyces sp. JV176]